MSKSSTTVTDNEKKKRQVKSVALNIKLRALKEIKCGRPISIIAKNLNVTNKTVKNWLKNSDKLLKWEDEHCGNLLEQQKRMRKADNDLVDKATWIWYKQKRLHSPGINIPGTLVQTQAKHFNDLINKSKNEDKVFEASKGWHDKWRKRNNISYFNGKKLSCDSEFSKLYKQEFSNYLQAQHLTLDQIFYCDKTIINYKVMPKKITDSDNKEPDSNNSNNKNNNNNNNNDNLKRERVTILTCCNATGTFKLPLLVIGKYPKPRAIKNLSSLPVNYTSDPSTNLTYDIFKEWFEADFIPRVSNFLTEGNHSNKRATLFMDNCLINQPLVVHSDDNYFDSINIKHFPTNFTLFSSNDDNYLFDMKKTYRLSFMSHFIERADKYTENLNQILKDISLRDVIKWTDEAWNKISEVTIRKSWDSLAPVNNAGDKNINDGFEFIGIPSQIKEETEDGLVASKLREFYEAIHKADVWNDVEQSDVNTWFYSNVLSEDCLSDKEIINLVMDGKHGGEKKICSNTAPVTQEVSILAAKKAINTLIKYCEQNDDCKEALSNFYKFKDNLKTGEEEQSAGEVATQ
ncbi:tigger transposable element-derived protein 2-like [Microplitis mediator]|uniref:tigger transposable element-derived protein 2-like n=1 Tax=Microplitis mediator TaxID=375433 RepID=UPI002556D3F6|nr:tigger transposable element-derived protein 2-like [Microplitis mediator]